jgi:hypothetical protein
MMTLNKMTLGMMTLNKMTLGIMTLSKMTISKNGLFATLRINETPSKRHSTKTIPNITALGTV